MTTPFLTAEWKWLAMLSWRVDPTLLESRVPRGTELDLFDGHALVSIVGFRFLDTRVKGIPIPFHRDFDEVNVRFYVKRDVGTDVRHGVTFIREIVPRPMVSFVARAAYDEPYVSRRMRSEVTGSEPVTARYSWREGAAWNELVINSGGAPAIPEAGSEAAFVSEHFWGYTRRRDGSTSEYQVTHPSWRVFRAKSAGLVCRGSELLGPTLADAFSRPPDSAFLAEGSPVEVFSPRRV